MIWRGGGQGEDNKPVWLLWKLQLLFSNCVHPKLTYGAAVKDFSATEKQRYNAMWHLITQSVTSLGFEDGKALAN